MCFFFPFHRSFFLPRVLRSAPSSSTPAGGSRRRAAPPTIHRRRPTAHLPIQLCYRPRRRPPATGYPALPGRRRSRAASPPPAEPPPPPGRHRRRSPPLGPVVMELPPPSATPAAGDLAGGRSPHQPPLAGHPLPLPPSLARRLPLLLPCSRKKMNRGVSAIARAPAARAINRLGGRSQPSV